MSLLDLPPTPTTAEPVIVPGLLSGLGITRRPSPAWIQDPAVIESIALGLYEIDDDLVTRDQPTLRQIEQRLSFAACFYTVCLGARVAELERRLDQARQP